MSHSSPTLGIDGCLSRQSLQYFGSPRQPISALADTDIQAELLDLQIPHPVLSLALQIQIAPTYTISTGT